VLHHGVREGQRINEDMIRTSVVSSQNEGRNPAKSMAARSQNDGCHSPASVPQKITRDLRRASMGTEAAKEFCASEIKPRDKKTVSGRQREDVKGMPSHKLGDH